MRVIRRFGYSTICIPSIDFFLLLYRRRENNYLQESLVLVNNMKKMKLLSLSLILVFLASFHGTAAASSIDQASSVNIAVVYSTGGLGDQSFNDAAKDGVDDAVAEYGSSFTFDEACASGCTTFTDITTAIDDFAASSEDYDLIIGVGFSAFDGINASAVAHPTQNFMIIDAVVAEDNTISVVFKEEEGSFLAGAMAGMVTSTDKVAFLGGLDIPLINRFYAGYSHGAQYLNSLVSVDGVYSPDPNNPWGDLSGGQVIGDTFMDNGFDIIFSAAGGTGIGVINAVGARNDEGTDQYYAIGVDSDQDHLSEGDVLTSMVKRVDVAVKQQVDALFAETWAAGVTTLGLAEGGVGLSDMLFTQSELTADFVAGQSRKDVIEALTADIISGDIVVAADLSEIAGLLATQGNFEGLVQTTDDTTEDTTEETTPSDTLPIPIIPTLLAFLIAVPIVNKRKN